MTEIPTAERKKRLRQHLRDIREKHAASLPREVSALVFSRPPGPIADLVPEEASIGFYRAHKGEAPSGGYIRYFHERGHRIALPRITRRGEPMRFHAHTDPYAESDLEPGAMGLLQPSGDLPELVPEVLFMPLIGFTVRGERLGQGGGFYDRWLARHPQTIAIGMAWDEQEVAELPLENHDKVLTRIVTPTRVLGPF